MATPTGFDWSKCVFCQRHVPSSKTNCPADSKRADDGIGYRTLCETVSGFIRLGQLPTDLKPHIQHWDEGDEMESNFKRHRACWHIKCKQKFVYTPKDAPVTGCDETPHWTHRAHRTPVICI